MDISVWTVVSIGFTAGGVPIAVFNAVVLIGILRKKFLRNSFTMIAFMIFNGAATGVCMVAVGSFRIVGHLRYSNYMDDLVSSKQCIANVRQQPISVSCVPSISMANVRDGILAGQNLNIRFVGSLWDCMVGWIRSLNAGGAGNLPHLLIVPHDRSK
ncbi:unnamed protein product [Toxocara canis]|uniref:Transmembrane protein n=1 Tax=Toxocara canis TaxID=6265 RepID=A0A183USG9_TOXCA|nr:unnamed protein product [Toxocara canis]